MNKELEGKIVDIMVKSNSLDEAASSIAAIMPEPLAVLADRKGVVGSIHISERPSGWRIEISRSKVPVFMGPTYPAAEQAAREYLEKLEDVK